MLKSFGDREIFASFSAGGRQDVPARNILGTRSLLLAGISTLALALPSEPGFAQAQSDGSQVTSVETVVVTGSHIARQDYVSDSPVATIGATDIADSGQPTLGNFLNELPQVDALNSSGATSSQLGTVTAQVDLRGLGTNRTLTLLDGQRTIDGDTNKFPRALIDRVEVITGGASAVYGSDAAAGVVNFILKKDFSGLEITAEKGYRQAGDAGDYYLSATAGGNFADGKGNAVINFEYYNQSIDYETDRSWTNGSFQQASLPEGEVNFATNAPSQAAFNTVFGAYGFAPNTVLTGNQVAFNANGTLYSSGISVVNFDPTINPSAYHDNGHSVTYDTRQFRSLQPALTRRNFYADTTYRLPLGMTFESSLLASYNNTLEYGNPEPSSGTQQLTVGINNPFISTTLRELLNGRPNPTANFFLGKSMNELGHRPYEDGVFTYQAVSGLRGILPIKDWTWSTTINYSSLYDNYSVDNQYSYTAIENLLMAADGGQSLCTGGYDPFGYSTLSQSCRNYIDRKTHNTTQITQSVAEADLQGELLELPGGQARFALGADYRRNTYTFSPDAEIQAGDIPFQSGIATNGGVSAREVYGELSIPVVKDLPFVKLFEIDPAYRFSQYSLAGGVNTYKVDGDWEALEDLRFRGSYERAVIAPTALQLTQPQTVGFDTGIGQAGSIGSGDPCDVRGAYRSGPNGAKIAALCQAQGVPANLLSSFNSPNITYLDTTGGNPNLKPEKANSISFGTVVTPNFSNPVFSNMNFSLDWFSIGIDGAIGTVTGSQLLSLCYNANGSSNPTYSLSNPQCQAIARDPGTGQISNLAELTYNLAGYKTSGIDFQGDWNFGLEDVGDFGLGTLPGTLITKVNATYTNEYAVQLFSGQPFVNYDGTIGNTSVSNAGESRPKWKGIFSLNYLLGAYQFGADWRFISAMAASSNVGNVGTALGVPDYNYFDLSARWRISEMFTLYGTISNLTNLDPPVYPVASGGVDSATYDYLGRRYMIGVKANF
jgi:outer membrane receptor protein involved in Fe transport